MLAMLQRENARLIIENNNIPVLQEEIATLKQKKTIFMNSQQQYTHGDIDTEQTRRHLAHLEVEKLYRDAYIYAYSYLYVFITIAAMWQTQYTVNNIFACLFMFGPCLVAA